tara:strand:- start:1943 stop:2467 length:525 start_codon:yes stop_codon:yes gene_type:complete
MQNDHELIRKYQKGNLSAFDEIVRRHLSNTIGFFYNITRDQMASEDLAQDVFFKLHKHLKNFRFESALTTYLYRINVNTANSYLTRNKWKNFLHMDQAPDRGERDTELEYEWTRKELWDAIAKLPKKQRAVVMMRIAQNLPYKDISEITGMSVGTAKVNFHHAVNTLKGWLNDE